MTTPSKYPLSDLGDNFDPEAMPDYQERAKKGEFKNMTTEQIRSVYVHEEIEQVQEDEQNEHFRRLQELEDNEE